MRSATFDRKMDQLERGRGRGVAPEAEATYVMASSMKTLLNMLSSD